MNVSAICPVFNEEASVGEVLTDLRRHLQDHPKITRFEILVVDDGSEDLTSVKACGVPDVILLKNAARRGYGAALKRGISASQYDIVLMIDGDGSYPLDHLDPMLARMEDHDMVVGERDSGRADYPFPKRLGKAVLNLLVFALTGRKIKDLNSGLRLMRKDSVIPFFPIISDGFSFTTTITLAFFQSHMRVAYVPIQYRQRKGKSKIRPVQDTFQMIVQILQNIMFFNPLRVFASVALVNFIITAGFLFYDVLVRGNVGDAYLLFLISGFAFLFAGLMADLIHKKFLFLERKMTLLGHANDMRGKSEEMEREDPLSRTP